MRKPTTTEWMAGSFAVALAILLMVQRYSDPSGRLGVELQATARWSFTLFWLASTGRALATLFAPRFQGLARHARDLGLAFASAHVVHMGLVVWLLHVLPQPFPRWPLAFLSVGVLWVYLLVLLAIPRVAGKFAPKTVRALRSVGVEYIGLVFLLDFAKNPFQGGVGYLLAYLPFLALAIAGILLRRAAALKRLRASLADLGDVTDYRGAT
jgi:hypothetical protein